MHVLSPWNPLSTLPGQILINRTPSFAYREANLAVTTFVPALLMPYGAAGSISNWRMKSTSDMPDEIATTFLPRPLRTSGVNRLNRWKLPTTFTLNDLRRSFSRSSGECALVLSVSLYLKMNVAIGLSKSLTEHQQSPMQTTAGSSLRSQ